VPQGCEKKINLELLLPDLSLKLRYPAPRTANLVARTLRNHLARRQLDRPRPPRRAQRRSSPS